MSSEESISLVNKLIRKNRKAFDFYMSLARTAQSPNFRIFLLQRAAASAVECPAGFLASQALEDEILKMVPCVPEVSITEEYEPNSFLHVFSYVYKTGGHTRVAERWIDFSPEEQKHSVVILNPTEIPCTLQKNVQSHHGTIITLEEADVFEKAARLRETAARFEYVILHIHMDDVTPILAFGTESFRRPVLFFNHADHLFWLGGSVSDAVLNFRSFSMEITPKYRGLTENRLLPLPLPQKHLTGGDREIREKLRIPKEHRVLLTMATEYKYKPAFGMDIVETLKAVLDRLPDLEFIAIGPKPETPYWKALIEQYGARVHVLGVIPSSDVGAYLECADIVWDSFPFPSITALLESANLGKNVLTLKSPFGYDEAIEHSNCICADTEELIGKTISCLNDGKDFRLMSEMRKYHFKDGWGTYYKAMLENAPSEHRLHSFCPSSNVSDMEINWVLTSGKKHYRNLVKLEFKKLLHYLERNPTFKKEISFRQYLYMMYSDFGSYFQIKRQYFRFRHPNLTFKRFFPALVRKLRGLFSNKK